MALKFISGKHSIGAPECIEERYKIKNMVYGRNFRFKQDTF